MLVDGRTTTASLCFVFSSVFYQALPMLPGPVSAVAAGLKLPVVATMPTIPLPDIPTNVKDNLSGSSAILRILRSMRMISASSACRLADRLCNSTHP